MIGTRATPPSAPRTSTINPHLILANGSARPSQPPPPSPPPPPPAADIRPTQPHADNSNQPRSQPQSQSQLRLQPQLQLQLRPLQSRPPHRKSGGGKVGRKLWIPAHIETLLKLVESHCPIGSDHWEMISQIFNVGMEPPYQRSASQLKEKYFGLLHGRGMKKDNPQFQQYAIKAREIEALIEHKYQIVQSSDPFASHTTGGSESWSHGDGDGVMGDSNNEEGWNEPMEADETLTQPPPMDDSIMVLHAPASTASTAAAAAAAAAAASSSSSTAAAAAAAAAVTISPPQLALPTPPPPPQSSSSTSSPCSLSFTGKRRRSDLDRLISEALEREEQRRDLMEKAMVMMAAAISAMASNAEAAERRHEQLMALLLARKG